MNRLIAMCGLDCAACDAYLATQANDRAAQERVIAKWQQEYNLANVTLQDVTCDGCVTGGRLGGYCGKCEIRACGTARQLANCAHCNDYATCDKLVGFFAQVPIARANLDEIRRAL
ncbi:MAG: DUF3795 domain-containing protein [Chloroflexi bacterium]|nr:DUF3795 domain-containing protein [Chloroflexota bacterium]